MKLIFKKSYDLYKLFHEYRKTIPKQDRFTVYERSENAILAMLKCFLEAGYMKQTDKLDLLEKGSVKLNALRFFHSSHERNEIFGYQEVPSAPNYH